MVVVLGGGGYNIYMKWDIQQEIIIKVHEKQNMKYNYTVVLYARGIQVNIIDNAFNVYVTIIVFIIEY